MATQPPISETEQAVLKVLWDMDRGTVREVLDALIDQGHSWAYTTVQTLLTRLMAKGYVAADRSGPAHVYRAAVSRGELLQQRLSDLADTFCEGTTSPLMLALVEGSALTPQEIAQFRDLLDKLEAESSRGRKKGGKP
ncbi:MAG TPA: BlaI/MecI/CopY family transcriptional regulator [Gemmataceae bacterium]|nr:BlaI/MecI/CopY family transcriptional regulator [Gemmataceae bacterium]